MAEFSRTVYDFNSRIKFNDVTTDTTKYVLLKRGSFTDTNVINTEALRPDEAGIVDFGTKLGKGEWAVPVTLWAQDINTMNGLIQTFKEALNPDLTELDATYGESTVWDGYMPLDWTETVDSTSRDFRMYIKPVETPRVETDSLAGTTRSAQAIFKAKDPRKILQVATTITDSDTATNAGTYTAVPTITITASGATSTSLQIANSTTGESIYITTAMANTDVLVLDIANRSAKLNGTETRSMVGGSTEWFLINPGDNTIAISNGTNASVVTSWNSSWPL